MPVDPALNDELYCYLTTTGRLSGEPHEIEIWFGLDGDTLYMLSGGRDRSSWVRNLLREPHVMVRIGGATFAADRRRSHRSRELGTHAYRSAALPSEMAVTRGYSWSTHGYRRYRWVLGGYRRVTASWDPPTR